MRWTLVQEEEAHPGWQNMALDMALLEQSARHREGYLRLYRWAPHCLSFGRHEPGKKRYDRDAIDALGEHPLDLGSQHGEVDLLIKGERRLKHGIHASKVV